MGPGRRDRSRHTTGRTSRASVRGVTAALVTALAAFASFVAPVASAPSAGAQTADAGTTPVPQVVGGTATDTTNWPSMVGLLVATIPDDHSALYCGGTLVAPEWVL